MPLRRTFRGGGLLWLVYARRRKTKAALEDVQSGLFSFYRIVAFGAGLLRRKYAPLPF